MRQILPLFAGISRLIQGGLFANDVHDQASDVGRSPMFP